MGAYRAKIKLMAADMPVLMVVVAIASAVPFLVGMLAEKESFVFPKNHPTIIARDKHGPQVCTGASEWNSKTPKIKVRMLSTDLKIQIGTARAMDFWSNVVDLSWSYVADSSCSVLVMNGYYNDYAAVAYIKTGVIVADRDITTSAYSQYEVDSIMTHEVGHMLGLDHNPNINSIMFWEVAPLTNILTADDIGQLSLTHELRPHPVTVLW